MAGLGDLFGRHGVIEQLVLWGMLQQILGAGEAPFLTTIQQGVQHAHPVIALPPSLAADAAVRGLLSEQAARDEAARGGIDAARFAVMLDRARVRLSPGDVAEAVLRSYMTLGEGEVEVRPQGVDAGRLAILRDLAGDAIGPQDAARALLRGIITAGGRGAGSTSYEQAIAESRLHDKWGPVLRALAEQLNTPGQLAEGVIRNFIPRAAAGTEAARQGVSAAVFDLLVHLAGDAPGPEQLAVALRRGLVPAAGRGPQSTSFEQGIAEGRLADKWAPVIEGLAQLWPTPVDALDAEVKGQLTPAEADRLYVRLGGDIEFKPWLLDTIGESPTPLEAAIMAARGIIAEHGTGPAVLSYDQAVKESRYRNKWGPAYRALSRHIPPPSTVATFLARGVVPDQQGHAWLNENDLDPVTAAAYLADAEFTETSDFRGLTSGAVVSMYIAGVLTAPQATVILEALHVSPRAAQLLIQYADLRYFVDSINRSVQRIATLFVSRKIGVETARSALQRLGISPTALDKVISTLQIQAAADVKTLTAAEIADAWKYKAIELPEALGDLEAIGYTPYDAWVYLSVKNRAPLPNKPARQVAPPPGVVIPGVT